MLDSSYHKLWNKIFNLKVCSMKKHSSSCEKCVAKSEGIFCHLELFELEEISHHKTNNTYKKGQTLFTQGNHPFGIYCISTGNIKLTKTGPDGKETIVRIANSGDILGHRSLFTEDNYGATATAMEDSEVCFIDKKFILKIIEKNPSVALNVINKLSRDMGSAENRLTSFHQKNVRERLAELLLSLKASHGVKVGSKWRLDIKITREEMATMIGTASETLIRFMTEFREANIIDQDGKIIYIINEEELLNWANINY